MNFNRLRHLLIRQTQGGTGIVLLRSAIAAILMACPQSLRRSPNYNFYCTRKREHSRSIESVDI